MCVTPCDFRRHTSGADQTHTCAGVCVCDYASYSAGMRFDKYGVVPFTPRPLVRAAARSAGMQDRCAATSFLRPCPFHLQGSIAVQTINGWLRLVRPHGPPPLLLPPPLLPPPLPLPQLARKKDGPPMSCQPAGLPSSCQHDTTRCATAGHDPVKWAARLRGDSSCCLCPPSS